MRGQPGHSTWPHVWLLPSFQGMNAGMTSQPNVALICKLCWSLMCFAYIVGILSAGISTSRHCQTPGRLVQDLNVCTVHIHTWSVTSLALSKTYPNIRSFTCPRANAIICKMSKAFGIELCFMLQWLLLYKTSFAISRIFHLCSICHYLFRVGI